jgi:hypothetical protein
VKNYRQIMGTGALALVIGTAPLVTRTTAAQQQPASQATANGAPVIPTGVPLPPGYVIGPEDVLARCT